MSSNEMNTNFGRMKAEGKRRIREDSSLITYPFNQAR